MSSKNLLERLKLLLLVIIVISTLSACGGTSFIDDGNGHKQYKDEKGNFVKNDWVEIKGKKVLF